MRTGRGKRSVDGSRRIERRYILREGLDPNRMRGTQFLGKARQRLRAPCYQQEVATVGSVAACVPCA